MIKIRNISVRFVGIGEQFAGGETNRLCPMVEFYDSRFNRRRYEGRGQFIVRLAAGIPFMPQAGYGLQLDDRVPQWSLGPTDVIRVREYITANGGHYGVM